MGEELLGETLILLSS